MAREPKITVILPPAVAAYTYVYKADTTAPEGSTWKPDNKFKVTSVYDDRSVLATTEAIILKALKAKFPDVAEEDFILPFTDHGADARKEELRGKTTAKASSQFGPKPVDGNRETLPEDVLVKAGDIVRVKASLYLYSKTEKVKVGKKIEDVVTYGCSLQMDGIMLIEKRAGGGDDGDWGETPEGAYVAPKTAPKPQAPADTNPDAGDGDF